MRQVAERALWIGNAGDLRDARMVMSAGIGAVVEVADCEQMAVLPRELIRIRIPLSDGGENPEWLLRLVAGSVVALMRAHIPTLVCCSAGMSRSVCAAAAGISITEGCSLEEAILLVVGEGPADVSSCLLAQFQRALIEDSVAGLYDAEEAAQLKSLAARSKEHESKT